jgi:hypothetical protein
MWTSRLLSTISRHTKRRTLSLGRRMARHRTLRIETMEIRVPLSASALLAVEPAEAIVEPTDDPSDAVLVAEETAGDTTTGSTETVVVDNETAVVDSSDDSVSTVCFPVPTAEQVDAETEPVTVADGTSDDTPVVTEPSVWDADDVDWVDETLVAEIDLADAEADEVTPEADMVVSLASYSKTVETTKSLISAASPSPAPTPVTGGVGTTTIGVGVVPIGQPAPPVITSFDAVQGQSNVWIFTGQVNYRWPWTLTIQFGGLLDGESCSVNLDGTFNFSWIFPPDTNGIVSAQAFTPQGVGSNVVFELIA